MEVLESHHPRINIVTYKRYNKVFYTSLFIGFIYMVVIMLLLYFKVFGIIWLKTIFLFIAILSLIVTAWIWVFKRETVKVIIQEGPYIIMKPTLYKLPNLMGFCTGVVIQLLLMLIYFVFIY